EAAGAGGGPADRGGMAVHTAEARVGVVAAAGQATGDAVAHDAGGGGLGPRRLARSGDARPSRGRFAISASAAIRYAGAPAAGANLPRAEWTVSQSGRGPCRRQRAA